MPYDDREQSFKEWALNVAKQGDGQRHKPSAVNGYASNLKDIRRGIPPEIEAVVDDGIPNNVFECDDVGLLDDLYNALYSDKVDGDKYNAILLYKRYLESGPLSDEKGEAGSMAADNEFVERMGEVVERYGNVVFHGAPGTGKTFLAKRIAAKLITGDADANLDEADLEGRWGFVQFHPSYDYTDFVEGLRPISTENGNVGFELKPGTFTEFIDGVREANRGAVSAQAVFDEAWKRFYDDVAEKGGVVLRTSSGIDHTLEPTRSGVALTDLKDVYLPRNRIFEWWMGEGVEWYRSYFLAAIELLKGEYGLPDFDPNAFKADEGAGKDKYVFIIDEINRGDISKVFGELFFAIDPGYRGGKSGISTQYANLHESSEYAFKKSFFIPKNVFIIATMNDIDRSVDSFDYAMRRRFRFVDVRARDTQSMLVGEGKPNGDKALAAMTALNGMIEQEEGLGARYEFGASYFLGYAAGAEGPDDLWSFSLEPVLREYFHDAGFDESGVDAYRERFESAIEGKDPATGDSEEVPLEEA